MEIDTGNWEVAKPVNVTLGSDWRDKQWTRSSKNRAKKEKLAQEFYKQNITNTVSEPLALPFQNSHVSFLSSHNKQHQGTLPMLRSCKQIQAPLAHLPIFVAYTTPQCKFPSSTVFLRLEKKSMMHFQGRGMWLDLTSYKHDTINLVTEYILSL